LAEKLADDFTAEGHLWIFRCYAMRSIPAEKETMKTPNRKKNIRKAFAYPKPPGTCPNCGKPGAHFCPPAFGETGFYICDCRKEGSK
jgi:hypothetical protein